jgi:hypothetical protein
MMIADVKMTKVMASEFLHLKIRVNQIAVSLPPTHSFPYLPFVALLGICGLLLTS